MRLVTHAELQVLPGAVVDLVVAVDFRPLFRVFHVDIAGAEDPAEGDRYAAGSRRGVVGVAQVEVRSAAEAVQLVAGAAAEAGLGLRHVLGRASCRRPRNSRPGRGRSECVLAFQVVSRLTKFAVAVSSGREI